MKTPLLTIGIVLTTLPAALAWPFVERNTGTGLPPENTQLYKVFQADRDRMLEVFAGGPFFQQMSASQSGPFTGQKITLPTPDTDPYPSNFPVTWGHGDGVSADIDNDGDMDLVYSAVLDYNFSPEWMNVRVVACLNDGMGGWTRGWQFKTTSAAVPDTPELKLADFDRDGDLDLLETSGGVVIRWNDGAGNFNTTSPVLHGAYPAAQGYRTTPRVETGDFDGNGWQDFALFANDVLNPNDSVFTTTGRATVYYNQDGQNFVTGTFGQNTSGENFFLTAAADMDGDGRTDLLATRQTLNGGCQLVWYRNAGSSFVTGVILLSLTDSQTRGTLAFVPADLDEDGRPDLVFATRYGEVQWRRNTGGGSFDPAVVIRSSTSQAAGELGAADVDGDGDMDILTESATRVLENTAPHLRSSVLTTTFSGTALSGAVDLTTGDLNSDGFPDLIAADGGANRIRWYTGGATGLTEQVYVSTGSVSPLSVAAGDWNGDGWTDLAWAGGGLLRQALSTAGSGIGWNFSDAANMTGISGIVPGDIDRDGDLDLLSFSTGGIVRIHANNGSASWVPQGVDTGVNGLSRIALGQTMPGNRQEIAGLGATFVSHWRYTGTSWTETQPANPAAGTASRGLCLADISDTLAGDETIFSLNANSVFMSHSSLVDPVLLGTFSSPVVQLTPVDWNSDGYTDILVTTTNTISLLVHTPGPEAAFDSPALLHAVAPGKTLQDTVVLDVNRDSLPDAVTADSAGTLYLLTNVSYAVSTTFTASVSRGVAPQSSVEAARFHGTYQSRAAGDAGLIPGRVLLSFNRAVGTPGSDVAGTPMTAAEVDALVDLVSLYAVRPSGNIYMGSGSLTSMGSGGFAAETSAGLPGALASLNPESDFILYLRMKQSAANAPVTRFFVLPFGVSWSAQNALSPGGIVPVRARTGSAPDRTLYYMRAASPLELWRTQYFGGPDENYIVTGIAANNADPDLDGVPNLVEYLTGQDPKVPGGLNSSPVVGLSFNAGFGTMVPDVSMLTSFDSRVKATLQYSNDLSASWGTIASRAGTTAWTGTPPYATTVLTGGRSRYEFNNGANPAVNTRLFFRLKAEELP
ncbi:MAG TPA: VCBS repeat-containing protein [Verrucomicrobiales bacterium]|nr:VCBS repeat-containing protein [Verrucomicrobiales bacterium]